MSSGGMTAGVHLQWAICDPVLERARRQSRATTSCPGALATLRKGGKTWARSASPLLANSMLLTPRSSNVKELMKMPQI